MLFRSGAGSNDLFCNFYIFDIVITLTTDINDSINDLPVY